MLVGAKLIEDGALGSIVSIARVDQMPQRARHGLERLLPVRQLTKMVFCQSPHGSAPSLLVAPQVQKFADRFDGKSQQPSALDEAQLMKIAIVVGAITVG